MAALFTAGLALLPQAGWADRIVKVDGSVIERGCTVEEATYESVSYKLEGASRKQEIKADEVDRIEWSNMSATVRRGLGALEEGDFAGAERQLRSFRSRSSKQRPDDGLGHLLLGRAYLQWGAQDPAKLAEAVSSLTDSIKVLKEAKDFYTPHCMAELAEAQLAQKDFGAAEKIFDDLAGGVYGAGKVTDAQHGKAEVLLRKGEFNAARGEFGKLRGSGTSGQQLAAELGYARAQLGQKQYEGAVTTVVEKILKSTAVKPVSYGKMAAQAYIVIGDAEKELGKLDWALIRYLQAEAISTQEAHINAEALYKAMRLCKDQGHTDKAARLKDQLARLYPNSPWNKD